MEKKRGRRGGKNIQNKKQKLENENQIDFAISSKELDGETRNYLIEIEKKLNEFYNENELQELEILIENVFDEINGKEEMISRDFEASRILEKMITNCSDSKLMEFGIRMKPIFKDLITDQFGSHVVQTWLNKSSSVVEKEFTVGSGGSMQDIIVDFAELLTGEWQNYMVHKYASFVARTFLNVLSGDSLANESEIRSKKSQSFNENRKQIEKKKNRIVPLKFKELLQQIAEKVVSSIDYDNLIKLITNPVGNPVLQMLVSIPTSKCLIDAILKDSTLVHTIIKDRVGSHLFEKILANCNEKQYKQIYKVCFKNDIQEISRHFISNFVIQKLIESCKSEKIFIQIFDGLVNLFDEFICI
jgi:nucleolar protein 9